MGAHDHEIFFLSGRFAQNIADLPIITAEKLPPDRISLGGHFRLNVSGRLLQGIFLPYIPVADGDGQEMNVPVEVFDNIGFIETDFGGWESWEDHTGGFWV
jgi:hypothetical protein